MKKYWMVLISIIMIVSLVSCAKSEPIETTEDETVVTEDTTATEEEDLSTAEEDVPINEEDASIDLGNGYSFIPNISDSSDSNESSMYSLILKDGVEEARLEYEKTPLTYVGTYNDKFYFNSGVLEPSSVYIYDPQVSEFEEVGVELFLVGFDRESAHSLSDMDNMGIIDDRYVLATSFYATDAANGFGHAYLFDLETNESTDLGPAQDIAVASDGIYWTTTDPYNHYREPFNIVVYKSSRSGENIKTVKTIPIDVDPDESLYCVGHIDRRTVTWSFQDRPSVKEVYRDGDNDYILKEDLEVKEEPSADAKTKNRNELSEDGQKNALPGDDAVLKEGTVVTCLEIQGQWMRIPSGWISYSKDGRFTVTYAE